MPEFVDISQLTKKSQATGTEEFQVSATEKVTAQQIANLAPTSGDPQDATISNFTNTGTLVIPESVSNTQSIVQAIKTLAVLAGDNNGHRVKNFTSYIDEDSNNPINITIFEAIGGTTAGVYFGPKQIGFGVFPSKDFDQTLDLAVNDLQAYTFLKAQGFWTKEVNVADLGGGGSTSNPLDALMTGFSDLTSGFGYNIVTDDTLMMAIRKIWGHISSGLVRVIHGDHKVGVVEYNPSEDSSVGFVIYPDQEEIAIIPYGNITTSEFMDYTDEQLAEYVYNNGVSYQLDKLSRALTSQKSLSILSGSTGYVQWNNKYRVSSSQISLTLPSQNVSSHNASDTIEIWSSGDTTITFSKPGGTLVYLRDGDQTQPAGTLYKKTTITNPFYYYYFVTVDYFKSEY